ncbi:MAG: AAA family ATPase [Deltaproteobacteria bacterium]|nr:AAA family ATPase [Deltaproteobacteria bacterium]
MYEKFFFLKENPFNITPDPKFLYLSDKHGEALNLLFFGIRERKGFLLLTGEVGTGKTTLCRALMDKMDEKIDTALLLNPLLTDIELIKTINDDFGIGIDGNSLKDNLDVLNRFLIEGVENGRNAVVIIDEAQNLSPNTLEMIRLLSNLETDKSKLLQIILVGQPELKAKLSLPELRQLNQRIIVRYHLMPLNHDETKSYIFNRLAIAGGLGNVSFNPDALDDIHWASGGIPRLVNILCDRVMLLAFVAEKRLIEKGMVTNAVNELGKEGVVSLDAGHLPNERNRLIRYLIYIGILAGIIIFKIFEAVGK